jgi:hypothetical protein
MKGGGTRLERLERIAEHGKIFVLDSDEFARARSGTFALSYDERYLVADKAHDIGPRLGGAGAAQHRLIRCLQATLIDRHVFGRIDGDHAGKGRGFR